MIVARRVRELIVSEMTSPEGPLLRPLRHRVQAITTPHMRQTSIISRRAMRVRALQVHKIKLLLAKQFDGISLHD